MGLNDTAVRDGGRLHILTAPVGTTFPTPTFLTSFDPSSGIGNETQTITITGSPTGGTFTLTFASQTTAAIPYNASAAAVQAALEALSSIGAGNVACAGGPLPATAVTVTFKGTLAGTDVAQMTATSSLTGGTAPAVAVTTTTTSWAPWANLGHTDLDNDVDTGEDGGESTIRGTRQNPSLRETISPVTQFITINSVQVDTTTLGLYFGDGAAAGGVFSTDGTFTATTKAVLLVFAEGSRISGVHYPQASIRRAGPPTMAAEGFRALPIRITPLKLTGQPLQRWIDTQIV